MGESLNTRWSKLDDLHGRKAEDAWRWFIERYRTYIRIGLERMIQPRDRAVQATDEIWSYLFESSLVENADRSRRFRTYLAGTVRNFALSWLRRHPHATPLSNAADPVDSSDPAQLLEAADLQLWKQQVVHLALTELARRHPEQAQALRWFYGLPESAEAEAEAMHPASWIAEKLDIQVNAVHQIIFRGRKRLRECIEKELRETVSSKDDLDDEMRLIYEVIERESPGLEG